MKFHFFQLMILLLISQLSFSQKSNVGSFDSGSVENDTEGPSISITYPALVANSYSTQTDKIQIKGFITDPSGILQIRVNDAEAFFNSMGEFVREISLSEGSNSIVVTAIDKKQNRSELVFKIENLTDRHAQSADYINAQLRIKRNYALIIGVEDYEHNSINDLDHPIDDARKLMEILITKYTFEKQDVFFLENPSRSDIIQAFDKLAKIITPDDNLLIFYAGHGVWDEQMKKGYFLPKNASREDRSAWFSNSDLRDYIGGIKSRHTLLIADACFSGSIFKTRDAFTNHTSAATLELFKLPSRKAMTSGALKTVPDKSVFMEYLLKRLSENTSLYISAEQLFSSFKIAVINNSPNGQVPQFGEIKEAGDEGGDFIFIKK